MHGQFKTKRQAQNMRTHAWLCLVCGHMHKAKAKTCQLCQSKTLQYFPSQAEVRRYGQLKLKQQVGVISDLKLQPGFRIEVNGKHVTTYRADFSYTRNGQQIIEDVKGSIHEQHLDPVFKLKRKLVEAIYDIRITLVAA